MVSVYYFMTNACVRRPGAAASVECRRRERRTLLAGAAGELAGATRLRQARPSSACTFSACECTHPLVSISRKCTSAIGFTALLLLSGRSAWDQSPDGMGTASLATLDWRPDMTWKHADPPAGGAQWLIDAGRTNDYDCKQAASGKLFWQ